MVFIGGPRQVGKTTLCTDLLKDNFTNLTYLNWDNRKDRRVILDSKWNANSDLIVFDEIHKYRQWKSFIKGEFDKTKLRNKFLVTGSARLDLYRRGGDSLQGRYHYYRLHPFSLSEMIHHNGLVECGNKLVFTEKFFQSEIEMLLEFGGFPEPLFKQNRRSLKRWQNERLERFFREDIRDASHVRDLSTIQLMSDLLPERVGSPLSLNSLREDLEVSHRAVSSWIEVLENFYYCYRIYPFGTNKIRSLKKEPKLYLWNWSEVANNGARFENMIAGHLFKFCHYLYDYQGEHLELFYLRDTDKREVDFLVTLNRKPWFIVEVKLADTNISTPLLYFRDRLKIPYSYQVVLKPETDFIKDNVRVISAARFLTAFI